jgi:DtxR family transcriptional regulator, Mn-dependent transcriptional regulator
VLTTRASERTERYLQTVFELREDGARIIPAELGRRLGKHSTTISEATARLVRAGLIVHTRRIALTPGGESLARAVVRRQRLVECFLDEVVGLERDLIRAEALRWQHVLGDRAEAKIDLLLGRPRLSPFGRPVPYRTANQTRQPTPASTQ